MDCDGLLVLKPFGTVPIRVSRALSERGMIDGTVVGYCPPPVFDAALIGRNVPIAAGRGCYADYALQAASFGHRQRVDPCPHHRPSGSMMAGTIMTFGFEDPGMTFGFVQLP